MGLKNVPFQVNAYWSDWRASILWSSLRNHALSPVLELAVLHFTSYDFCADAQFEAYLSRFVAVPPHRLRSMFCDEKKKKVPAGIIDSIV